MKSTGTMMTMAALALAALAGSASAQLQLDFQIGELVSSTRVQRYPDRPNGDPNQMPNPGQTFFEDLKSGNDIGPKDALFTPTRQQYSYNFDYGGERTEFPEFNALSNSMSVWTQASSTRYELTVEGSGHFDWDTYVGWPYGVSQSFSAGNVGVLFTATQDARLRMSWDYDTSSLVNADGVIISMLGNFQSDVLPGLPSGFDFSNNPGSASVNDPFSFEFDIATGQSFILIMNVSATGGTVDTPDLLGWDYDFSQSLIIEVVPAPGAAALFGLGGLALARRRR